MQLAMEEHEMSTTSLNTLPLVQLSLKISATIKVKESY